MPSLEPCSVHADSADCADSVSTILFVSTRDIHRIPCVALLVCLLCARAADQRQLILFGHRADRGDVRRGWNHPNRKRCSALLPRNQQVRSHWALARLARSQGSDRCNCQPPTHACVVRSTDRYPYGSRHQHPPAGRSLATFIGGLALATPHCGDCTGNPAYPPVTFCCAGTFWTGVLFAKSPIFRVSAIFP